MLSALTEVAAGEKSYDEFPRDAGQIRVPVYDGVHVVGHTEDKSFFTGRTEYKDGIGVFSVLKTFQILVTGNIGTGA